MKFVIEDANHPRNFRTPEGARRRYTKQLEKAREFHSREEAENVSEFGERVFSLDQIYSRSRRPPLVNLSILRHVLKESRHAPESADYLRSIGRTVPE